MATEFNVDGVCPTCSGYQCHSGDCPVLVPPSIPVSVLRDEATVDRVAEAIHDYLNVVFGTLPIANGAIAKDLARRCLAVLIEQGAP